MELWDVYDKNRVKTDKIMQRGEKFDKDSFHLVVHVCIFNSQNKMLIQQRQSFKQGWSNMWDISAGGSALYSETSQHAIERELYEELGLDISFENIRPSFTVNFENGFDDIYLIKKDIEINDLTLQYEEVQSIKWATQQEILDMIHSKTFVPYHKSFIQFVFEMKDYRGLQK